MSNKSNDLVALQWLLPPLNEQMSLIHSAWQDNVAVDMARASDQFHEIGNVLVLANLQLFAQLAYLLEEVCWHIEQGHVPNEISSKVFYASQLLQYEVSHRIVTGREQKLLTNLRIYYLKGLLKDFNNSYADTLADAINSDKLSEQLTLNISPISLTNENYQEFLTAWTTKTQELLADNTNNRELLTVLADITNRLQHGATHKNLQTLWYIASLWLVGLGANDEPVPAHYQEILTQIGDVIAVQQQGEYDIATLIWVENLLVDIYVQLCQLKVPTEDIKEMQASLNVNNSSDRAFFPHILSVLESMVYSLGRGEVNVHVLEEVKMQLAGHGWSFYEAYAEQIIADIKISQETPELFAQMQWQITTQLQDLYTAILNTHEAIENKVGHGISHGDGDVEMSQQLRRVRILVEDIKYAFSKYLHTKDIEILPQTDVLLELQETFDDMGMHGVGSIGSRLTNLFAVIATINPVQVSWEFAKSAADGLSLLELFLDGLAKQIFDNALLVRAESCIDEAIGLIDAGGAIYSHETAEKFDGQVRYDDTGEVKLSQMPSLNNTPTPVIDGDGVLVATENDALAEENSLEIQNETKAEQAESKDETEANDIEVNTETKKTQTKEIQAEGETAIQQTNAPLGENTADSTDASQTQKGTPALSEAYLTAKNSLKDDSFDFDEDICEIFVEEADEVLETLSGLLPVWQKDPSNLKPLTDIRRGFHTLKGSGRMVGANNLGEMAWAVENMLNRVLDGTIASTHTVAQFVGETAELIPTLVRDFDSKQAPSIDPAIVVLKANNILAGREVAFGLPVATAVGAVAVSALENTAPSQTQAETAVPEVVAPETLQSETFTKTVDDEEVGAVAQSELGTIEQVAETEMSELEVSGLEATKTVYSEQESVETQTFEQEAIEEETVGHVAFEEEMPKQAIIEQEIPKQETSEQEIAEQATSVSESEDLASDDLDDTAFADDAFAKTTADESDDAVLFDDGDEEEIVVFDDGDEVVFADELDTNDGLATYDELTDISVLDEQAVSEPLDFADESIELDDTDVMFDDGETVNETLELDDENVVFDDEDVGFDDEIVEPAFVADDMLFDDESIEISDEDFELTDDTVQLDTNVLEIGDEIPNVGDDNLALGDEIDELADESIQFDDETIELAGVNIDDAKLDTAALSDDVLDVSDEISLDDDVLATQQNDVNDDDIVLDGSDDEIFADEDDVVVAVDDEVLEFADDVVISDEIIETTDVVHDSLDVDDEWLVTGDESADNDDEVIELSDETLIDDESAVFDDDDIVLEDDVVVFEDEMTTKTDEVANTNDEISELVSFDDVDDGSSVDVFFDDVSESDDGLEISETLDFDEIVEVGGERVGDEVSEVLLFDGVYGIDEPVIEHDAVFDEMDDIALDSDDEIVVLDDDEMIAFVDDDTVLDDVVGADDSDIVFDDDVAVDEKETIDEHAFVDGGVIALDDDTIIHDEATIVDVGNDVLADDDVIFDDSDEESAVFADDEEEALVFDDNQDDIVLDDSENIVFDKQEAYDETVVFDDKDDEVALLDGNLEQTKEVVFENEQNDSVVVFGDKDDEVALFDDGQNDENIIFADEVEAAATATVLFDDVDADVIFDDDNESIVFDEPKADETVLFDNHHNNQDDDIVFADGQDELEEDNQSVILADGDDEQNDDTVIFADNADEQDSQALIFEDKDEEIVLDDETALFDDEQDDKSVIFADGNEVVTDLSQPVADVATDESEVVVETQTVLFDDGDENVIFDDEVETKIGETIIFADEVETTVAETAPFDDANDVIFDDKVEADIGETVIFDNDDSKTALFDDTHGSQDDDIVFADSQDELKEDNQSVIFDDGDDEQNVIFDDDDNESKADDQETVLFDDDNADDQDDKNIIFDDGQDELEQNNQNVIFDDSDDDQQDDENVIFDDNAEQDDDENIIFDDEQNDENVIFDDKDDESVQVSSVEPLFRQVVDADEVSAISDEHATVIFDDGDDTLETIGETQTVLFDDSDDNHQDDENVVFDDEEDGDDEQNVIFDDDDNESKADDQETLLFDDDNADDQDDKNIIFDDGQDELEQNNQNVIFDDSDDDQQDDENIIFDDDPEEDELGEQVAVATSAPSEVLSEVVSEGSEPSAVAGLPTVLLPFMAEAKVMPAPAVDEVDDDIKEIYIEEADEVLETIIPLFDKWQTNKDKAVLTDVRRGFHTLKGSGRMVGAVELGELAWSIENMLNRVLDGTVVATDGMVSLIEDVLLEFSELVGLFEQNSTEYPEELTLWIAVAHAYSKGHGDSFDYRHLTLANADSEETSEEVVADVESPLEAGGLKSLEAVSERLSNVTIVVPEDEEEQKLCQTFVDEVRELLVKIDDFVADNVGKDSVPVSDDVVRAFHTLRGGLALQPMQVVGELASIVEENLQHLQRHDVDMTAKHVQALGATSELIEMHLHAYELALAGEHHETKLDETVLVIGDLLQVETQNMGADDMEVSGLIDGLDALLDVELELESVLADEPHVISDYTAKLLAEIELLEARTVSSNKFQKLLFSMGSAYQVLNKHPEQASDDGLVDALLAVQSELIGLFDSLAGSMSLRLNDSVVRTLDSKVSDIQGYYSAIDKQDLVVGSKVDEPALPTLTYQDITTDPDLLEIFLEEASELDVAITDVFGQWREDTTNTDALKALQRHLHTIKGGARLAGISSIGDLTHEAETVYEQLVDGRLAVSDGWVRVMQGVQDILSLQIEEVRQHKRSFFAEKTVEELQAFLKLPELPADANITALVAPKETIVSAKADVVVDEQKVERVSDFEYRQLQSWQGVLPDSAILGVFLEEAEELVESSAEDFAILRSNTSDLATLQSLQRKLHTIKGGARMVSANGVADLAHNMETVYEDLGTRRRPATRMVIQLLLSCHDWLAGAVSLLKSTLNPPTPLALIEALSDFSRRPDSLTEVPVVSLAEELEAIATYEAQEKQRRGGRDISRMPPASGLLEQSEEVGNNNEMIRISAGLMERMINLSGEAAINRARIDMSMTSLTASIEEMGVTAQRLADQLRRMDIELEAQILAQIDDKSLFDHEGFDPLEMDQYSSLNQLSKSLSESASDLLDLKATLLEKTRDGENLLLQLSRTQNELQDGLMYSRMVPFSRLTPRLQRIVRQVSSELGKHVELSVVNADDEMDRTILERITSPLEHMLRNAIDHGIEMPEERAALGKPKTGHVVLEVVREGSEILVHLTDDGAGINVDAVRKKAISQGLISANDTSLSDVDIMQYIFNAGLSTTSVVTQISGRGVGMDVVRSEIRQLGGSVSVDSVRGQGSRFTMRVPLTVAVSDTLVVRAADRQYAIPLVQIERVTQVSTDDLLDYYQSTNATLDIDGVPYRLRYLNEILSGHDFSELLSNNVSFPVILVKNQAGQNLALQVDEIVGSRIEVVVKPLGRQLSNVSGISAATIMGDGSVMFILDLMALLRNAQARVAVTIKTSDEAKRPVVLVVDDSVTVRKVTSRFLERQGYEAVVAKDGVDAMEILQELTPDLMLLDIEMPRMDGFEVAMQVRRNQRLEGLPIIMITSRTGEKHRERAFEIGVSDYMGKPFQEADLLARIQAHLGL